MRHPLGELGVTYALHLQLVGKRVVDFLFTIIEHLLLIIIIIIITVFITIVVKPLRRTTTS